MPAYKDEKTGTWYCKFYCPDGEGGRVQKMKRGFASMLNALLYESAFRDRPDGLPQMDRLITDYLADCRSRLKPTTFNTKFYIFRAHILPYFGRMDAAAVTPGAVRQWQNALLSAPHGYTRAYIKGLHNQLSALFNYGVRYCGLADNPARRAGSPPAPRGSEMRFWTRAQFCAFAAGLERAPDRLMFELLFWGGLRCGELLALTPEDFDLSAATVSVSKTYARLHGRDLIQTPKTPKSTRTVALPAFLIKELRPLLLSAPAGGRVFPVTKYRVRQQLLCGCARADLPPIRVHDATVIIGLNQNPITGRRFSPIFLFICKIYGERGCNCLKDKQRRPTNILSPDAAAV